MFKLTFENERGNTLVLTPDSDLSSPYSLSDIDGLNPPKADINTSELALIDGQQFNSSKLQMRSMNVAFTINEDAAQGRVDVYKVLKTKHSIRLHYESETRDVYVDGWIESIAVEYMGSPQVVTVNVICPSPYWQDAQSIVTEISQIIDMFHFWFASTAEPEIVFGYIDPIVSVEVENGGDVETGLVFEIYAREQVINPRVVDYVTGEFIQVNTTMEASDLITIDTRAGHKTATLLRAGETSNVFNRVARGSTWLQLPIGGSVYTYTADEPTRMNVEIKHTNIYEGV